MPMAENPSSSASLLVRMSAEQREQVRRDAAARGMTMRAWAMHCLGVEIPQRRKPGPPARPKNQRELPMAG